MSLRAGHESVCVLVSGFLSISPCARARGAVCVRACVRVRECVCGSVHADVWGECLGVNVSVCVSTFAPIRMRASVRECARAWGCARACLFMRAFVCACDRVCRSIGTHLRACVCVGVRVRVRVWHDCACALAAAVGAAVARLYAYASALWWHGGDVRFK